MPTFAGPVSFLDDPAVAGGGPTDEPWNPAKASTIPAVRETAAGRGGEAARRRVDPAVAFGTVSAILTDGSAVQEAVILP